MALRNGYTTGTCAAIAAKAALRMIFEQKNVETEAVTTPKGVVINTRITEPRFSQTEASCAVKKDAGDDPDVTDGILVYAYVRLRADNIINIDGGKGVGRVTKAGLWQNIGEAAINRVPREQLKEVAVQAFDRYGYEGGADIIVSVPEGEKIAQKTFNPRLGIVGGISILGTSGIVEPMSEQAIIDTIRAELAVKRANEGEYVMIAPGNYGVDFIRENYGADLDKAVKCSNFVGEAVDSAIGLGFKGVLFIGHIGKFVKLSGGIMNTHSKNADCRMELMASAALEVTAQTDILTKILKCNTTDEAIDVLNENNLTKRTMAVILRKALFYLNNRSGGAFETGLIIFSDKYGLLAQSDNVAQLFKHIKG